MALSLIAPRDQNNIPVPDPLSMYKISEQDAGGNPKYYGYLAHDGSWYIQKWNTSANTFRYISGRSGYQTNWTNRASLGYDYFDAIF